MPQVPTPLSAKQLLLKGVAVVNVATGGSLSIIASVLIAVYLPGSKFPLWLAAIMGLLGCWFTVAALYALSQSVQQARDIRELYDSQQPKTAVVSAVPPFYPYGACRCILVVEWSPAAELPVGTPVTISTAETSHELPLGNGTVRPKQQDGKAVISLDRHYAGVEKYISALLDATTSNGAVQKLRIGPAITLLGVHEQSSSTQMSVPGEPVQANIEPVAPCNSSNSMTLEPRS